MGAIKIPSADLLKKSTEKQRRAAHVSQALLRTLRRNIIMIAQSSLQHRDVQRSSETTLTTTEDRSLLQVSTLILSELHARTEPM